MKKFTSTDKAMQIILPILVIVFVIVCWEGYVWIGGVDPWLLPRPYQIVVELFSSWSLIFDRMVETLEATVLGFVAAVIASFLIATMIDLSQRARQAIYPLLIISQTIPYFIVAPLLIIWFDTGLLSKLMIVLLVCFFPITLNLADGFRQVDREMIRMLDSMGASRWQIYRMVKIPGAMPNFFTGLKIAGTYSVMGAVLSEMLGGNRGLGIMLIRASRSFEIARVFAVIVVVVALSLALYVLIVLVARWTMPWLKYRK